jgi:hypothetical protein
MDALRVDAQPLGDTAGRRLEETRRPLEPVEMLVSLIRPLEL